MSRVVSLKTAERNTPANLVIVNESQKPEFNRNDSDAVAILVLSMNFTTSNKIINNYLKINEMK